MTAELTTFESYLANPRLCQVQALGCHSFNVLLSGTYLGVDLVFSERSQHASFYHTFELEELTIEHVTETRERLVQFIESVIHALVLQEVGDAPPFTTLVLWDQSPTDLADGLSGLRYEMAIQRENVPVLNLDEFNFNGDALECDEDPFA